MFSTHLLALLSIAIVSSCVLSSSLIAALSSRCSRRADLEQSDFLQQHRSGIYTYMDCMIVKWG